MFGRLGNLTRLLCSQHEETMASLEEIREESERRHEEWKADLARRDEEAGEFNREILLRNEKVYTRVLIEMEEHRDQLKANTQAVLRVLDRLS